jgi:general L-amino acid transport system permease protein
MATQASEFAYVRREMVAPLPPPAGASGFLHWVRTNLFATVTDSILSLLALLAIAYFVPPLLDWLFFSAQWTGSDRTFCATVAQGGVQPEGWAGACWAFVGSKFGQFMFNVYPQDERWRVILCAVLLVVLLVPFLTPRAPYKGINALLLFVALPIVGYFLLVGGSFGLRYVPTRDWGGFMVTIVLSYVGIVVSLPLACFWHSDAAPRCQWSRRSASSSSRWCAACRSSRSCSWPRRCCRSSCRTGSRSTTSSAF